MKNLALNFLAALAVTSLLTFASCKKYDDGPGLSLRTKKARLVGEWQVKSIDGFSYDVGDYQLILEFEKDGDFEWSYIEDGYSYSYKGDWEFSSDKKEVELSVEGERIDFEIKRLTNKELWFEDEDGDEWRLDSK